MRRLIKTFEFTEEHRASIQLGAGTRLHPTRQRVELAEVADGTYNTSASGFTVRSWVSHPEAARQWLGFQSFEVHPFDVDAGSTHTSIRYRLGDGSDEYVWDGSAWAVSTAAWNTEAEIAANIASFPIADQSIQVIANLATTNKRFTPALLAVKVLFAADIAFQEDLIYRSLVRSIREEIRATSDLPYQMPASASAINLGQIKIDTPYTITGVDAVYDHTSDPDHLTNLLDAYDSETKVITLTAAIDAEALAWIRFVYEPEVMVHTSRDYLEIGKVPALVISDINVSGSFETGKDDHIVLDKATGAAVKVPSPKQCDFDFSLRILADKARDLHRLQEAVRIWIRSNPTLRSRGLDERYGMAILNPFDGQGVNGSAETHAARIRFRVLKALFYDRPDEDAFATVRFTLRGPPDLIVS